MANSPLTTGDPRRVTSLRWRWYRAFALLTTIILIAGLAGFVATQLLVQTYRESAVRVERESSIDATLRGDIVAHAIALTTPTSAAQRQQVDILQATIRAQYGQAIANEHPAAAVELLRQSSAQWEAIVQAAGTAAAPASLDQIAAAITGHDQQVLTLLDQAGATSRAAVRVNLAHEARRSTEGLAILAGLELLALALAVRLARRLSTEVLQPVRLLRDSANHLASGQLDHRIVIDRNDELGELAASFNAMAESIAGSQRLLTLEATTDSLSGLANRSAFRARLAAALARADRRNGNQAVLFVDLDDFKDVNDTLGHSAGDELLVIVAQRLGEAVRPGDLVARLGGDEFALLLDNLANPEMAAAVAERVVAALDEPFKIGDTWAHVGASVGMALREEDSTLDSLMREADVAMYTAKRKGKNRVERYDATLDEVAIAYQLLKVDIAGAVERGELALEYQPVVDLDLGTLVGLEALVRWRHPVRGLLAPSEFIGLAEETGAIIGIGVWVLETATRQLHRWQRSYDLADLWVSVNVSMCQLDAPDFAAMVTDVLRLTGVDASNLVLEVTESVLADPAGGAANALAALRTLGARVALDDFGTGYSSIGYLLQLPVDILKIDRTFVSGPSAGLANNALLEAVVAMAHRLSLDVIPEGIEEPDQLSRLRAMGCHIGQGFLLSRPAPGHAIEAMLASRTALCDIALWEEVSRTQITSPGVQAG